MYKKMDAAAMTQLLETGIEEFSEAGLDRANINTIAKKAGVSVGVIYKYFKDKDAFFLECVRYSLRTLDEVLDNVFSKQADLRTLLIDVIHALQDHAKKYPKMNVMYNEITSGSTRKYAAVLANEIEERSAVIYKGVFENAIKEGIVKDSFDPKLLAFFLDNLLVMLQFSYSCDYYNERMKIFLGEELKGDNEAIAEGMADLIIIAVMKQ